MTYLGVDWNRHGGDWEELNREGMPTRLLANGVVVHDYMVRRAWRLLLLRGRAEVLMRVSCAQESPAITRSYDFALPAAALEGAPDELVLAVEAKNRPPCAQVSRQGDVPSQHATDHRALDPRARMKAFGLTPAINCAFLRLPRLKSLQSSVRGGRRMS
eukprot:51763-Prymnesium_polylepis.1